MVTIFVTTLELLIYQHGPYSTQASVVVACGFGCPVVCGIFLDQGLNQSPALARQFSTREAQSCYVGSSENDNYVEGTEVTKDFKITVCAQHVVSLFPDQGLNLCLQHWKYGVLTTGLPWKSKVVSVRSQTSDAFPNFVVGADLELAILQGESFLEKYLETIVWILEVLTATGLVIVSEVFSRLSQEIFTFSKDKIHYDFILLKGSLFSKIANLPNLAATRSTEKREDNHTGPVAFFHFVSSSVKTSFMELPLKHILNKYNLREQDFGDTLISDFSDPELSENRFLFRAPRLVVVRSDSRSICTFVLGPANTRNLLPLLLLLSHFSHVRLCVIPQTAELDPTEVT
ncbi:hypothetical protein MG293_000233 [Ovis ammon polii]|uniref:Uncharacterized protein n=1 Tax=Ovis ammon polii TaxID=230172 RepID=A0AAD4YH94_OVIAM|nr:hypothetical protein MG293_000233 [Ovis ammon polii]